MCVSVCVCERERERECVCMRACICAWCTHVSVNMRGNIVPLFEMCNKTQHFLPVPYI